MNDAIKKAFQEYRKYKNLKDDHMVVVDFSKPSTRRRLHVVDLKTKEIIRSHHVAHGSRTNCVYDRAYPCYFSNKIGSRKSSLGAMKTGKVYTWGKRFPTKRKLKLHGLEKQNSNVFVRGIIIHSANYVTNSYIKRNKRAGNSWGCLAVDKAICDDLIDLIKNGCFVYVYFS